MSTHGWSMLTHGSTGAIAYTIRGQEEYYPTAPPTYRCSLLVAFASDAEPLPILRLPSDERYHQICKELLAAMFAGDFPYMDPPSEFLNGFLRVIRQANILHRCRNCHPEVNHAFTTVVRIEVRPRPLTPIQMALWESFEEAGGGSGVRPTSKASVAHLLEEAKKTEEEIEGGCVICMEEIVTGKSAVRMPCSHVFHEACLVQWLNNSHVCPLCRYEMPYSED